MAANDNKPSRSRRPVPENRRGNVAALVAVLVLAAALFWIVSAIHGHDAVQNCLDSGRHDCVELDGDGR